MNLSKFTMNPDLLSLAYSARSAIAWPKAQPGVRSRRADTDRRPKQEGWVKVALVKAESEVEEIVLAVMKMKDEAIACLLLLDGRPPPPAPAQGRPRRRRPKVAAAASAAAATALAAVFAAAELHGAAAGHPASSRAEEHW
jgi:alkylation response protein AidB-like acyl-CoA dehydrogenase